MRLLLQLAVAAADAAPDRLSLAASDDQRSLAAADDAVLESADDRAIAMRRRVLPVERVVRRRRRRVCRRRLRHWLVRVLREHAVRAEQIHIIKDPIDRENNGHTNGENKNKRRTMEHVILHVNFPYEVVFTPSELLLSPKTIVDDFLSCYALLRIY